MDIKLKLALLVALLFAIMYGIIAGFGAALGAGGAASYLVLALFFLLLQYLVSPYIVSAMMRVRWVSEREEPELHKMVEELSAKACIPKPKVGISELSIPNAFAFGRTLRDGRVCVTRGLLRTLGRDELRAVLGHEISHIKNRDMIFITLLSAVPLALYWIAWSLMFRGMWGRREEASYAALLGFVAFLLYFITNLLALWGSRLREYLADEGSVKLGNPPWHLATALYKIVRGSARSRPEELRRIEGLRAFFLNDPAKACDEVRDLVQVDVDRSGTIDPWELEELRRKRVRISAAERMMELLSSHPHTLKRIKRLSELSPGLFLR